MKKLVLILGGILLASAAYAKNPVYLTIDNQSNTEFQVTYKGQDTTIDPEVTVIGAAGQPGSKVTITMTQLKQIAAGPVGTFLLNPYHERIGISVLDGEQVIVTGCRYCIPPDRENFSEHGEATVTIKTKP